jgi:hypothetical protein
MSTNINFTNELGKDNSSQISFNLPRKLVLEGNARANNDGGVSESDNCEYNVLNGLGPLLKSASLVVTPTLYRENKLYSVVPSNGAGDFSVARATTATRVNSAGLVELVPYNLLQYSEQFNNGVWGAVDTTITANSTIAPNGTLTADTITITSSTSRTFQTTSLGSGTYTASVYVKSLSGTPTIQFRMVVDGADITDSIATTTDWVRHDFTFTASTSMDFFVLRGQSGTGSVAIWGAQLVEGSTAKDYLPTTTRLNIPRLDYTNGSCPSILVEPQRTNLALYSEKLVSGFAFSFTGGVFTVDENTTDTLDPFGNNNADKFTTTSNFNDSYTTTLGSGILTLSIFAKKGTNDTIQLYHQNVITGNLFATTFNLNTGTIVGSTGTVTPKIEEFKNGWYRCSISGADTLTNGNIFRVSTYTGTTYLFGWQLEQGSYATSYIPTTSASVTRNADVISKTGISSLIGQTEGTIFVDIDLPNNSANDIFTFSNTGVNDIFFASNGGNIQARIYSNSTPLFFLQFPITSGGGRFKIAISYKSGNSSFYVNGILLSNNSGAIGFTTTLDTINLTNNQYAGLNNKEFNLVGLWKTALTNSQLAQLTTL